MRYSDAAYWMNKKLEAVAYSINVQDYLTNDEQRLVKEIETAMSQLDRIEELLSWLETNNYIEEDM